MHERIIGLYEENAAAWDQQRGRDLFERPWLDRFLGRLPSSPSILDLGCGMGEPIGRYFIERGAVLTGVDSSPSLIALCRERFPDRRWLVAGMRRLRIDERFDGIVAWHSFFHLSPEDQAAMFPWFASHLKRGGHLMFTSGDEDGVSLGEWRGEPLYHSSLSPEAYRRILFDNGMEVVENVFRDPECGQASVWIARLSGTR